MKKKFFSVLLALVLVCSFSLVTAVPGAANNPVSYVLVQHGNGAAEWSTSNVLLGNYSVKLSGGLQGPGDNYAAVVIPMDGTMTLSEVTTFIYKYTFDNNGEWGPHMCFYTHDPIDDETGEITLTGGSAGPPPGSPATTGEHTVTITPVTEGFFWFGTETGSGIASGSWPYYSLAEFQADVAFSTHVIDRIQIEYGWWSTGDASEPAYVDDVTLNTTTYDLELPALTAINVDDPNGGEHISGTYTVEWSYTDYPAPESGINLAYTTGLGWTNFKSVFATGLALSQSCSWDTTGLADGTYQVRVAYDPNPAINDISDALFTIDNTDPTIMATTLISPNGGEVWAGASKQEITWEDGDITDVNLGDIPISIEYYDGASWVLTAVSLPNDGSYLSTVASLDITDARVRVTATDLAGNTASDVSDAVFTIDSTEPLIASVAWGVAGMQPEWIVAGDLINVMMTGEESGTASFDILDTEEQPMAESPSGTYTGSYTVVAGDDAVAAPIVFHLVDEAGNSSEDSTLEISIDTTAPSVSALNADPALVPADGTTETLLTANVTDDVLLGISGSGVASVTIDLSAIGGAADQVMTGVFETYTCVTTVALETPDAIYDLFITATDVAGYINDTQAISLEVCTDVAPPVIGVPAVEYPTGVYSARVDDQVIISVEVTDPIEPATGVASVSLDASAIDLGTDETLTQVDGTDIWTTGELTVGEVDPGIKTLTISALDNAGLPAVPVEVEVEVTLRLTGYNIALAEDWNLMSLPLIPDNTAIIPMLASIAEHIDVVWGYDPVNSPADPWAMYVPGLIEDDLTQMVGGMGYWISMTGSDTLAISGIEMPEPPTAPPAYDVAEGWNLMGVKDVAQEGILYSQYLISIDGDFSVIWGYVDDYFNIHPIGVVPETTLWPGQGCWLWMQVGGIIVPPQ